VKNHDFTPKNQIFSIAEGGAKIVEVFRVKNQMIIIIIIILLISSPNIEQSSLQHSQQNRTKLHMYKEDVITAEECMNIRIRILYIE
jgi:hypothetical protein